jgi:hypothetical protein
MLTTVSNRVNTLLLVLLVLMAGAIIAILATRANGGSLDPPGPPASTMHTLDDIYTTANNVPPSWDQKLDSTNGSVGGPLLPAGCNSDRFTCVFPRKITLVSYDYDGVLDRETGLVWQRSQDSATIGHADWQLSALECMGMFTGDRSGWRLPTQAELSSLRGSSGDLPSGNPFLPATLNGIYWTSTEAGNEVTNLAYNSTGRQDKAALNLVWCVRGSTSNR